jgi:Spy/CpxP family protein refolding chaperone
VGILALLAVPVSAQQRQRQGGGGAFGSGMSSAMLLFQKSVQEDLKMTDDQVKKVTDLSTKQREAFTGLRDLSQEERGKKLQELTAQNEKAVGEILKPEQAKRLKEISLQTQGARALANDAAVAKSLALTGEQQEKIKAIEAESRSEAQKLFQGGIGNFEEAQKKRAELTKATNEKAMAVLTPEQKTKWKEMTGEPFKGEIRFGFGGARRPDR